MPADVDILGHRDSLRKPLLGSAALHGAIFGTLLAWEVLNASHHVSWGDANSGGPGSVAINMVNKIPLPMRSGIVNPLANDTQSAVPTPPPAAKPQRQAPAEEPDAIPIKSRAHPKQAEVAKSAQNNYRAQQQDRPNQLYSQSGQALVSPMIGQTGSGGVGIGLGSPFGNRFGNYVAILRQRVAEKWHTGDVDSRVKIATPVIVTFDLMRDGSVRDVRIGQHSGNVALDYSAQRAIYEASPFPPLPAGYERNDAVIEFWFELRR
jgi:periplasmic protein TonB